MQLRRLVKKELSARDNDPRPEIAKIQERIAEVDAEADKLLAMMTPTNRDFIDRKLAKLRRERRSAESRLQDLQALDYKPPDVEATVDAIVAQLADFERVAAQGTIEERKQFVRGLIESIAIHPHRGRGEAHLKRLPALGSGGGGNDPVNCPSNSPIPLELPVT